MPHKEFSTHADFFLPCIPCVTYQCLWSALAFIVFLKESILIGLAIARSLVIVDLVYPNVGAVLCGFERAVATQISGVAGDDSAGKA